MSTLFAGQAEKRISFSLPKELEATEPAEVKQRSRDAVRLLVTDSSDGNFHTAFTNLPGFINPGDLLVVNTSGTRNAAINGMRHDGEQYVIHLSNQLDERRWRVEIRSPKEGHTERYQGSLEGDIFRLEGGAVLTLVEPNTQPLHSKRELIGSQPRLWIANLHLPDNNRDIDAYLNRYGRPIRYKYVPEQWPSVYYQTIFANNMGSAEMPSAGRPFTAELVTALLSKGIQIAPVLLHTGVASLESHEPPYSEYFSVSEAAAKLVNVTHNNGGKVIAVGTTVVRALESVTSNNGYTEAGNGWTDLIITPERGLYAVDGLLTGFHEPEATHLHMLLALKNLRSIQKAYDEALEHRYLWHEFGDMHLILR